MHLVTNVIHEKYLRSDVFHQLDAVHLEGDGVAKLRAGRDQGGTCDHFLVFLRTLETRFY